MCLYVDLCVCSIKEGVSLRNVSPSLGLSDHFPGCDPTRGGSRAIPGCSAHQVYYQSPDGVGPVCDKLLTRAQGHSALELPLITSSFGHLGAVVHGAPTTEWFWI